MTPVAELLDLPVEERLRIIGELWDSIAAEQDTLPLTEAEKIELDKRLDAFEKDPDAGIDWETLKENLAALKNK